MDPIKTVSLVRRNNPREILSGHIDQGLELIKEADYEAAIDNFQNQSIAEKAGFNLVLYKVKPIRKLATKEEIFQYLDITASFSGLSAIKKEIEINKLVSLEDWLLNSKLKDLINLEEALLFAEEWIHAFQDAVNGTPISSHAKEIYSLKGEDNKHPVEIEVADYFLDHGLDWNFLKETHWIERYARQKILAPILFRLDNPNA